MRSCGRMNADVGPVRVDTVNFIYLFSYSFFFHPRECWSCPHGHTYVLTFFLGNWKCEWGVDLGCERKHFLDQISNPHI
jgi:hypothetical protein